MPVLKRQAGAQRVPANRIGAMQCAGNSRLSDSSFSLARLLHWREVPNQALSHFIKQMAMRIYKLTRVLIGLIAASIVSYGTTIGGAGMVFTSTATSAFGSLPALSEFGVVQSIEATSPQRPDIGFDKAPRAVMETVAENQAGPCNGNTAGAMQERKTKSFTTCSAPIVRVTLRLDDGSLQSYAQRTPLNLHIGDRVLIASDIIEQ